MYSALPGQSGPYPDEPFLSKTTRSDFEGHLFGGHFYLNKKYVYISYKFYTQMFRDANIEAVESFFSHHVDGRVTVWTCFGDWRRTWSSEAHDAHSIG